MINKKISIIAILLAFSITFISTPVMAANVVSWASKTPMSVERCAPGGVELNGYIYVMGGSMPGNVTINSMEAYNPVTNTWMNLPSMPTARYHLGAAALNGKIYAIGGNPSAVTNGNPLSTVEIYDASTNMWTTGPSMPTARMGLGVVALNGKIYAVGGADLGTNTFYNKLEIYDPGTNTWTTGPNMPTAKNYVSVVEINNKI